MASTSSVGASGGIDVPTLVSQLMSLERKPIDQLNTKVTSYQAKISSFGTLSGLISSFKTAAQSLNGSSTSTLQAFKATASDTSILSASASSTAVAGSYSLTVAALAQSQNLVAAGKASSSTAISDGVATTLTFDLGTISGGTLTGGTYSGATFTSNGSGTHSITIDSSNNTLQGIRDAINAANMGVTATIINDGSATPYRLAITSNTTGVSNSIKITTSGGDGTINSLLGHDPAGTQHLNQTVAAQNASFTANGIAITSTSNTVTDVMQGVSMTLNKITSTPISLTVARDTEAINKAAAGFVDAYNALYSQLKSRSAFGDKATPGGALAGDGTVRMMQNQLHAILNTPATGGTLTSLGQVGISSQSDGTLKLDSSKLSSELSKNYSDVTNLFSSATGFATQFEAWSTSVLSPGNGLIATRTTSLRGSIDGYNAQIDRLEKRMAVLQKQYTTTYSNLNVMLSNMNNTSSYLTVQLAKL